MMDSILFWNAVALEANRVSFTDPAKAEQQGPAHSARALAIVHLAMYDAYAGIVGTAGFPRYVIPPVAPAGASAQNAVAGAAFQTLSTLYSMQKDYFEQQLDCFDKNDSSFKFGVKVGEEVLALRANDPGAGADGYKTSTNRYRHRVDPDNPMQGYYAPYYGSESKPFASSIRQSLDAPPQGNAKYKAALKQVKAKGIKTELTATLPNPLFTNRRTAEETLIGTYWGYDGSNRLGTPPRFYNQIVRQVAMKQNNTEGDNARLFAFVNAAMGDAGIFAWEQKYCHDFWRPVLGIREHDESFGLMTMPDKNPANTIDADADPNWLPLGAPSSNSPTKKNQTPNFPAYPSGHATFGAAALHITRLFYSQGVGASGKPYKPNGRIVGDTLLKDLGIISDEFNGMNQDNRETVRPRHIRKFDDGLGEMIVENGLSRVYLGVHWSFDAFEVKGSHEDLTNENLGGVSLGLKIAADIFSYGISKAPKLSPAAANPPAAPCKPAQPADLGKCVNKTQSGKAKEQAGESQTFELPYRSGISSR